MLRTLGNHLRGNLVAYLALFVALGGTAYAAVKLRANSVGTKQLKNNAVTASKLDNGSVTATKVARHSLTGTQINASALGTVPNATDATSATNAATAANATDLGGQPASAYPTSPVAATDIGTIPAARVANTNSQQVATGLANLTALLFNTTNFDNDHIHSSVTTANSWHRSMVCMKSRAM